MTQVTAKRTLVKSPPELWSELSELDRLARHLEAFGEIKITKLEPEHTVAWEGAEASGSVSIEPSGWGTKVTLMAEVAAQETEERVEPEPVAEVEAQPEPEPEPEPEPAAEADPPHKPGFLARFFGWAPKEEAAAQPEPDASQEPEPASSEPEPELPPSEPTAPAPGSRAQSILEEALEALGSAHHRPFPRFMPQRCTSCAASMTPANGRRFSCAGSFSSCRSSASDSI